MAKLSRIITPQNEQDPLPTFMVWSQQSQSYQVYDSCLGNVTGGHVYTSSELWNAYSGWTQTNSAISSNGGSYYVQACTSNSADGSYLFSSPAKGGRNVPMNRNPDTVAGWWSRNAVIVTEPGVRQPWSIHINDNYWAITPRGGTLRLEDLSGDNAAYKVTGTYAASYGAASYNQRTQTLVIIQGAGSNNYRAHFWKHPKIDLMAKNFKMGQFSQFLSEAKAGSNGGSYFYNDFNWATSGSTSTTEAQYHLRVVMGDNGYVGLARMSPGNQTTSGYFISNPVSGSGVSVSALISLGLTTSYGVDNGAVYGMKHQNTWNSDWIACYSQYYYYGSGINAHFIYAKDPSKQYYRQDANTTFGVGIVPIEEDKFLGVYHINNDGNAQMQLAFFDPNGHLVNGTDGGGSAISNGGSVRADWINRQLDTPYTSTNYSAVVSMGTWWGGSR